MPFACAAWLPSLGDMANEEKLLKRSKYPKNMSLNVEIEFAAAHITSVSSFEPNSILTRYDDPKSIIRSNENKQFPE